MKRYEINTWGDIYKSPNNAAYKAPLDVDQIYGDNGFKVVRFPNVTALDKLHVGVVYRLLYLLFLIFRFKSGDEVHVQLTGSRITKHLIRYIRFRVKKIVLLVHDVNFLRYGDSPEEEIKLYNRADELIVHTEAMAEALKQKGMERPVRILTLFDYLIKDDGPMYAEKDFRSIVFAGNFFKSPFIKPLIEEAQQWNLNFYFYGSGRLEEMKDGSAFHYEGSFAPDQVSAIKGAWGLVWDGDSLSGCNSYLKYNSSHKISLYLVSGKPVIIWSQSSLYAFVTDNRLGIAVDSLQEIPERLSRLTEDDYREYAAGAASISERLRNGGFLSAVLNQ